MTSSRSLSPFVAALGPGLDRASQAVRQHLVSDGRTLQVGVIRRGWSRGPWGRLAARVLHLDGGPDAGEARFELRNEILLDPGGVAMRWQRTHYRGSRSITAVGSLRWNAQRSLLIDSIGRGKWLEVALMASVEDRAVVMASRRQWLRIAGIRVPLPRFLFGSARTREWEEPDGRLGLSLTLQHPLFGAYAGYEAVFAPDGVQPALGSQGG